MSKRDGIIANTRPSKPLRPDMFDESSSAKMTKLMSVVEKSFSVFDRNFGTQESVNSLDTKKFDRRCRVGGWRRRCIIPSLKNSTNVVRKYISNTREMDNFEV